MPLCVTARQRWMLAFAPQLIPCAVLLCRLPLDDSLAETLRQVPRKLSRGPRLSAADACCLLPSDSAARTKRGAMGGSGGAGVRLTECACACVCWCVDATHRRVVRVVRLHLAGPYESGYRGR
jgi:hypothetical protein